MLPDGGPMEQPTGADGRNPGKARPASEVPAVDFSPREAVHTVSYWLLLAGSFLRLTAKAGVMLHIIPIMVWKGIDAQTAAVILGLLFFVTVPCSLVFGWLADALPKNLVLCVTAIAGTAAFMLLASPLSSIWVIYLFVFLFAVAETSGSNNWATFGDYFGRKAYGRLRGLAQLASSPGVFIAPVFAGWWYDRVESYTLPLWVFTGLFGLGALSFALMRKPRHVQTPLEPAASTMVR
jgi:MFS family permease